jgi:hypothetical protein
MSAFVALLLYLLCSVYMFTDGAHPQNPISVIPFQETIENSREHPLRTQ